MSPPRPVCRCRLVPIECTRISGFESISFTRTPRRIVNSVNGNREATLKKECVLLFGKPSTFSRPRREVSYDQETEVREIPHLLEEERSKDRKAQEPRNVRHARRSIEARASHPVLQASGLAGRLLLECHLGNPKSVYRVIALEHECLSDRCSGQHNGN